jgi:hypothetical protein
MNKTIIPERVDYEVDSLDVIRTYEVNKLEGLIKELNQTDKLCSMIGQTVVAEFGFKGNLQAVQEQLKELKKRYVEEGLKEKDRPILIANDLSLIVFLKQDDVYSTEFKKLLTKDFKKAMEYNRAFLNREKVLHEKKECLCYNN